MIELENSCLSRNSYLRAWQTDVTESHNGFRTPSTCLHERENWVDPERNRSQTGTDRLCVYTGSLGIDLLSRVVWDRLPWRSTLGSSSSEPRVNGWIDPKNWHRCKIKPTEKGNRGTSIMAPFDHPDNK